MKVELSAVTMPGMFVIQASPTEARTKATPVKSCIPMESLLSEDPAETVRKTFEAINLNMREISDDREEPFMYDKQSMTSVVNTVLRDLGQSEFCEQAASIVDSLEPEGTGFLSSGSGMIGVNLQYPDMDFGVDAYLTGKQKQEQPDIHL